MQNEMRDRLVDLVIQADTYDSFECKLCDKHDDACDCCQAEKIADHLIENGVIVPPCKVGDKVYVIMETSCEDIDGVHTVCEFYNLKSEDLCTLPKGKCPYRYRIAECYVTEMNLLRFTAEWGKIVFLTKEEAEQKQRKEDEKR